jgi:DNA-binding response OmpR family regulator
MPPGQKSVATILVVDDEPLIADTIAQILTMYGYKAHTAYNAEDALEMALKSPPTLMLTDVMLPGMNGVELAITLQEALPDCKIVLFSGQAGTAHLLDDAKLRGHAFPILAKPVHPRELLDQLKMRLSEDGAQPVL